MQLCAAVHSGNRNVVAGTMVQRSAGCRGWRVSHKEWQRSHKPELGAQHQLFSSPEASEAKHWGGTGSSRDVS